MVYYDMKEYDIEGYEKAKAKGKMYNALLKRKSDGKTIKVPFGSNIDYNFQDKTGLNLYPRLIHGDKERRRRYRLRHKTYLKDGFYSPGWFSWHILW